MLVSLLKAVPALIALIGLMWRTFISAKDRALGREEATADALRKQAEENKAAVDAADQAEGDHAKHPDDDGGFDTSFRRTD